VQAKAQPTPVQAKPAPQKPQPVLQKAPPAPAKPQPAQAKPTPPQAPGRSSLFSGGAKARLSDLSDEASEMGEAPASKQAAPAPPPTDSGPTFRDVPMPDPEPEQQQPAEAEINPEDEMEAVEESGAEGQEETPEEMEPGPQIAHAMRGGKHHEILARVKEVLVAQSTTVKNQQHLLDKERQRAKRLADELSELKRVVQDLQARVAEDDSAIAELGSILDQARSRNSAGKASEAA
jgi:hypothetical protein